MQETIETDTMRFIKVIHLRIEQKVNETLARYGVTAAQLDVLQDVMEHQTPDIISSEVHRRMHLSKANISSIIKKLRVKGFLEFEPNPMDDRQKRIVVTEKARAMDQELIYCFDILKVKLYQDFTPEEMSQLNVLLKKLFANISPKEEERRENI